MKLLKENIVKLGKMLQQWSKADADAADAGDA